MEKHSHIKYFKALVMLLWLGLQMPSALAGQSPVQRIEPLNWWTGMANPRVQLMLYGEGLSEYQLTLDYPGVSILNIQGVDNPNYLFVTLLISKLAKPGTIKLQFKQHQSAGGFIQPFELQARAPDSAKRNGFSSADAIYLLVPDRFANANPDNDATADTLEKPDRNNPDGRHGGDIQGIVAALPYLADMGFSQLWATPLTENNSAAYSYHGYAATDLYRIDPRFGSNDQYRQLVVAANAHGIGVIQDVVLNHIGIQHWWMRDLPDSEWINNKGQFTPTNHARHTVQDPYASAADKQAFVNGWFVDSMPDLNQRHPLLANYLIQNSIWWIEYAGLSGIREDTYSYADKQFLAQWSQRILAEYPNFTMVGEEWSANPQVVSYWQQGKQNSDGYVGSMPSMMDFPGYYAMLAALNQAEGWDSGWIKLYESLANDRLYPAPYKLVMFDGNHDTARLFSLLDNNYNKFAQAMVLLTTLPRIPQFFYGTEILLTSPKQRNDGLVRSDFPGGWRHDPRNGMTAQGLVPQQRQAQQLLRRLLHYRRNQEQIHSADMTHFAPQDGIYSYVRGAHSVSSSPQVWVFLSKNNQSFTINPQRYQELQPERCLFFDVLSEQRYDSLADITIAPDGLRLLECQRR